MLGVGGVGYPDDQSSRGISLGNAKAISAFPDLWVNLRNPDNLRTNPAIFLSLEWLTMAVASSRKWGWVQLLMLDKGEVEKRIQVCHPQAVMALPGPPCTDADARAAPAPEKFFAGAQKKRPSFAG
jgi:hypothetical protein